MSFSIVFFISILMLAFVFAGVGIKILIKKNGKFSGTCASQSPFLNNGEESCGICGAKPEEKCKNEKA